MRASFVRPPTRLAASSTIALFALMAVAPAAHAQRTAAAPAPRDTLDRTAIPAPGPTPELHVPAWTTTTLANGAQLIVAPRRNLPLVSFTISFVGGANQYEPATKPGLADATASMMSEGTTSRTGDQLSNALQRLGTDISFDVGGESGSIRFLSTTDKFERVLGILQEILVQPSFPADALERYRARALVALTQAKDRTDRVAARVFPKVLYSETHPYGRSVTETSLQSITRDDIVAFDRAYFIPQHAIITVAGDVDPAAVQTTIERALAQWTGVANAPKPNFTYADVAPQSKATIYLVDKPGAAQSSFQIGLVGPPRNTPDYFALQVMNTILGGQFQSRLNANIREQKGFSYGVGSGFSYGKGPGPFRASGDIVTAKSDSALIEFMNELNGIKGARPITDEELNTAKDLMIQRLPQFFGSVSQVNGSITSLYMNDLAPNYFQTYSANVRAVTRDDVLRVARKYVDTDHMAIVIVGDRKTIEPTLKATGIAPIVVLNVDGDPAAIP